MRIDEIESAGDVGLYVLDQVGHGGIVVVAALPVRLASSSSFTWTSLFGTAISGAGVLLLRELESYFRANSRELRLLDRSLDVVFGTLLGVWFVVGLEVLWRFAF